MITPEYDDMMDELGLYEGGPTVCVPHMRFIPCRKDDGCRLSDDPEDVAHVEAYHRDAAG